MPSLTGQESSKTQPGFPVNPGNGQGTKDDPSVPFKVGDTSSSGISGGAVDKSSYGNKNASDTSEQRRGEDITFNTQHDPKGGSQVGQKTASESLIDSIERNVQ